MRNPRRHRGNPMVSVHLPYGIPLLSLRDFFPGVQLVVSSQTGTRPPRIPKPVRNKVIRVDEIAGLGSRNVSAGIFPGSESRIRGREEGKRKKADRDGRPFSFVRP